jgi:hypothetical protein
MKRGVSINYFLDCFYSPYCSGLTVSLEQPFKIATAATKRLDLPLKLFYYNLELLDGWK